MSLLALTGIAFGGFILALAVLFSNSTHDHNQTLPRFKRSRLVPIAFILLAVSGFFLIKQFHVYVVDPVRGFVAGNWVVVVIVLVMLGVAIFGIIKMRRRHLY